MEKTIENEKFPKVKGACVNILKDSISEELNGIQDESVLYLIYSLTKSIKKEWEIVDDNI